MMRRFQSWLKHLQRHVAKPWYHPFIAFIVLIDHFVIFIPSDALLVMSVLAFPRRWVRAWLWVTLGSVFGGLALAWVLQRYGTHFLDWISPGILTSKYWLETDAWVHEYGLWSLLVVSALPIFQHPVIAITALAGHSLLQIGLFMLAGRLLKFGIYSWVASHTPRLLKRFSSVQKEIEEVQQSDDLPPE